MFSLSLWRAVATLPFVVLVALPVTGCLSGGGGGGGGGGTGFVADGSGTGTGTGQTDTGSGSTSTKDSSSSSSSDSGTGTGSKDTGGSSSKCFGDFSLMESPFSSSDSTQIGAKCDAKIPKNCPFGESLTFNDDGTCVCIIGCGKFNPAIPLGGNCNNDGTWKCLEIASSNGNNKKQACVAVSWGLCTTGGGSTTADAGSTGTDTGGGTKTDTGGPTCKAQGDSCSADSQCCSKKCDLDFESCE